MSTVTAEQIETRVPICQDIYLREETNLTAETMKDYLRCVEEPHPIKPELAWGIMGALIIVLAVLLRQCHKNKM